MSSQSKQQASFMGIILGLGLFIVIIAAGAFFFIQQSGSDADLNSDYSGASEYKGFTGGGSGRSGGPTSQSGQRQGIGNRMVVGTVTAADASSLTIETSDGTRTFTVTSDTEVLAEPQQPPRVYDPNDFEIGSTIAVAPDSSDSNLAETIALNYQTRTNQNQ